MDLLFESSKTFEKELSKFPPKERSLIVDKINKYCSVLETENMKAFFTKAYQPTKIKLHGEMESSLYTLRINKDIRVILTVDDDPLFNQTIITLLHVVRHSSLEKTFRGIAEALYQKSLNSSPDKGGE